MIPKKSSTHPGILADAESYVGRKLPAASTDTPDPVASKATAAAFHAMPHDPSNPAVAASYDALKREVAAQWDHLKSRGVTFTASHEPYATSADMAKDARENRHLRYFPSEGGFGSADAATQSHPLLEKDADGIPFNDKFRAVHDYFGHAMHGHQFGPVGEYRAYLEHAHMFTPEARAALTTETHGQNSWVNYGPHSHLPVKERPYADQKAGLLPQHHWPPLKLSAGPGGMNTMIPGAAKRMHQHLFRVASTPRQRFHGLSVGDTARQMVKEHGNGFPHVSMLAKHLGVDEGEAHESLKYLAGTGKSLGPRSTLVKLAKKRIGNLRDAKQENDERYNTRNPVMPEALHPFLRTLAANPADHLVLHPIADWLQENGHGLHGEILARGLTHPEGRVEVADGFARPGSRDPEIALGRRMSLTVSRPGVDGGRHLMVHLPFRGVNGEERRAVVHAPSTTQHILDLVAEHGAADDIRHARRAVASGQLRGSIPDEPARLARITPQSLQGASIHPAFRGTALAYHLLKLASYAREKHGAKSNPLLKQIRGILAGKREVDLKQHGDPNVNPFAAVGRYLKQFASHSVPEELHGYADRFKFTTSDRRHDLDRKLYELIQDRYKGDSDAAVKASFHKLTTADDATKRGFTEKLRRHLGSSVDLPGDHHTEILNSIGRLRGYALDRETVAAGGGKTHKGNVKWSDWFEHAANPFVNKAADPMRLARGPVAAELKPWAKALELHPDRAGPFADWLEENGHHHNDETLSFLRSNPDIVKVAKHPKSGKVVAWGGPRMDTREDVDRLRVAHGWPAMVPSSHYAIPPEVIHGPRGSVMLTRYSDYTSILPFDTNNAGQVSSLGQHIPSFHPEHSAARRIARKAVFGD